MRKAPKYLAALVTTCLITAPATGFADDGVIRAGAFADLPLAKADHTSASTASASAGFEYGTRRLPEFNDTMISRTEGRNYVRAKPELETRSIKAGFGFQIGATNWQLQGRLSDGTAEHHTITLTDPRSQTATISLDGRFLEPGKFVPSIYDTTLAINEVSGELRLLRVLAKNIPVAAGNGNTANLTVRLGPAVSYRKQDIDVDYIAGLDYYLGPTYADRTAVHMIREDLEVFTAGATVEASFELPATPSLSLNMGLRAYLFAQHAKLKGSDCLTGAFNNRGECDGRHHVATTIGGTYYSPVKSTATSVGADLRLSGGLSYKINGATRLSTIAHLDIGLNEAAVDNPTFDAPHAARIKTETSIGYGLSTRLSVNF